MTSSQQRGARGPRAHLPRGFAAGAALALTLGPAAAAWAEPPQRLPSRVTDSAGVLSQAQESSLDQNLLDLANNDGVDVYVVYVDSFDGVSAQSWTEQTYQMSDMGPDNAVLAIAVQDRNYFLGADDQFPVSQSDRDTVVQEHVLPALRSDNWAGAGEGLATGLADEIRGGGGGSGGGLPGTGLLLPVVGGAAVLGAVGIGLARRRRRQQGGTPAGWPGQQQGGPAPVSLEELDARASRALVSADEDVRSSTRELSFAQAEFGDGTVAPYAAALDQARASLTRAFQARQQLDDAHPETPEQRRQLLEEILQRTAETEDVIAEQKADFDRLRDLGRRAGQVLPQLQAQADAAEQAQPTVSATVADLRGRYSDQAVAPIATAPDQIAERLKIARDHLAQATGKQGSEAAGALHTAEEALGQIGEIQRSVADLGGRLEQASAELTRAVPALQADVSAFQGARPATQERLDLALSNARSALAYAGSTGHADPIGALNRVVDADRALDQAVAEADQARQRASVAADRLGRELAVARQDVRTAQDVVDRHHGGMSSTARTRLNEALRWLAQAEATAGTDPEGALNAAQNASRLARDATEQAGRDLDNWGGGGYGGGYGGGRRVGLDPISVIVGGALNGFGSRGGWGGNWGGGGFGGGGGGGGGFGGSGGRF